MCSPDHEPRCFGYGESFSCWKAYADGDGKFYENRYKLKIVQTEAAVALIKAAGLPPRKDSISDIPRFEKVICENICGVFSGKALVYLYRRFCETIRSLL